MKVEVRYRGVGLVYFGCYFGLGLGVGGQILWLVQQHESLQAQNEPPPPLSVGLLTEGLRVCVRACVCMMI